ncbi:AAA family ATPase [Arthrobacter sp. Soil762]|uniref:AAA family ATPase n=1 Tax=Arthrobacter sp. Soil762 TaxID=1736401 RepID=UPI00138F23B5|nr:ATP-binding protein [Arthrobacter sp. Soil762]
MLQLLRKLLRNPPASLSESPDLLAIISAVTNEAVPPSMPLRAVREAGVGRAQAREVNTSPLVAPTKQLMREYARVDRPRIDLPDSLTREDLEDIEKPILSAPADTVVDDVIQEHVGKLLAEMGVPPTRTLLLTGEPGTGKTMTAKWIAASLQRELYTIDLGALMSHELGQSAANLQLAMRTAARHSAVLFIDELDAVAKSRGDSSDVGEARRLVNVFLLELDQWPEGHLLIGATNHPELLDRAVGRRFERRVNLSPPDNKVRAEIIMRMFPYWETHDAVLLAELTPNATGSDLRSLALAARRRAAAKGSRDVGLADAIICLHPNPSVTKRQRDRMITVLHAQGMSARAIASIIGITHPTVAAVLKSDEGTT